METLNKKEFIAFLEKMIDGNYEIIDNKLDGDDSARREIDTLENVIYFMKNDIHLKNEGK